MKRVEITNPFCFLFGMQVCAIDDATDEEILARCNTDNPSGTTMGWTTVLRETDDEIIGHEHNKAPVACQDHNGRTHYIVLC